MDFQKLTHWVYEIFQLKRLKHCGWYKANVPNPDSVAEHTLMAAQIGYVLAQVEGADADKVLKMLVFHDNPETRVGDMDKINCRYITNKREIESAGLAEQLTALPSSISKELNELFHEMEDKQTLEAQIVKDADHLEQAFQAMIYKSQGVEGVQNWIENVGDALRTESAKKLYASMLKTSPNEWYVTLKYLGNV